MLLAFSISSTDKMRKKSSIATLNSGATFHLGRNLHKIKYHKERQNRVFKFTLRQNEWNEQNIESFYAKSLPTENLNNDGLINDYTTRQEKIAFSLNKKKRWELKDQICAAIDELSEDPEAPLRMTCIERELDPREWATHGRQRAFLRFGSVQFQPGADCTGYHDSLMQPQHAFPTKRRRAKIASLRNAERQRNGEGVDKRKFFLKQRQTFAKVFKHFRNGRSEQRRVNFLFEEEEFHQQMRREAG